MTREITLTELGYLRSKNQASELKLAFPQANVVFSALCTPPDSVDSLVELIYTSAGYSDYEDILPGMTVWIGNTVGSYDLGIARVRLDGQLDVCATSTKIYIGETSDLKILAPITHNIYLTVVDEFLPWARHIKNKTDSTCWMDYNIDYDDQNVNMSPVVNMGPDGVINVPDSDISIASPATITFDGTGSFMPDGTDIDSYQWFALGTDITISDDTTTSPIVSVTAGGKTWRIGCTVTGENGKVTTGWRTLVAFDKSHPPINQFNLTQIPSGKKSSGGWSFEVTLYDQVAIEQVRERQQVILFARDYYTDSEGNIQEISLGPIQDRENILCVGWVSKEDLNYDPDGASVTFTVEGPAYWLNQISEFILGIEDTDDTSADWTLFHNLTMDKGLFMLLYWRSTVLFITDYFPSGNAQPCPSVEAAEGSLWEQIKSNAWNALLCNALYNRYGQLYIQLDPQFLTSRNLYIPVVMTAEKEDVEKGSFVISKSQPSVSHLVSSGVEYAWGLGGVGEARLALSPGNVFKQFGSSESLEKLLLSGQEQLNTLTSLYIAKENNEYPEIPLNLVQNNRFMDICPWQFVYCERAAADNPRGIDFAHNIIPTEVSYRFDSQAGFLSCEIKAEAEVFADNVVTQIVIPPENPDVPGPSPAVPPYTPVPFPTVIPTTYTWIIGYPLAGTWKLGPRIVLARQVLRVDGKCQGGTSVTVNIRKVNSGVPAGTNLLGSNLVVPPHPSEASGSVSVHDLAASDWLFLDIIGVSGAVTEVAVTLATVAQL